MRKIRLLLQCAALSLVALSCSKDSAPAAESEKVTFKIDGIKKTFKVISVSQETDEVGDRIDIVAYNSGDLMEGVNFSYYTTGTETTQISGFKYYVDAVYYDNTGGQSSLTSTITTNTATQAKGTFQGNVSEWPTSTSTATYKAITEGSFLIKYDDE